ncbi:MAG: hypothetical protein WDW38_000843 [Sanguina aurantia]
MSQSLDLPNLETALSKPALMATPAARASCVMTLDLSKPAPPLAVPKRIVLDLRSEPAPPPTHSTLAGQGRSKQLLASPDSRTERGASHPDSQRPSQVPYVPRKSAVHKQKYAGDAPLRERNFETQEAAARSFGYNVTRTGPYSAADASPPPQQSQQQRQPSLITRSIVGAVPETAAAAAAAAQTQQLVQQLLAQQSRLSSRTVSRPPPQQSLPECRHGPRTSNNTAPPPCRAKCPDRQHPRTSMNTAQPAAKPQAPEVVLEWAPSVLRKRSAIHSGEARPVPIISPPAQLPAAVQITSSTPALSKDKTQDLLLKQRLQHELEQLQEEEQQKQMSRLKLQQSLQRTLLQHQQQQLRQQQIEQAEQVQKLQEQFHEQRMQQRRLRELQGIHLEADDHDSPAPPPLPSALTENTQGKQPSPPRAVPRHHTHKATSDTSDDPDDSDYGSRKRRARRPVSRKTSAAAQHHPDPQGLSRFLPGSGAQNRLDHHAEPSLPSIHGDSPAITSALPAVLVAAAAAAAEQDTAEPGSEVAYAGRLRRNASARAALTSAASPVTSSAAPPASSGGAAPPSRQWTSSEPAGPSPSAPVANTTATPGATQPPTVLAPPRVPLIPVVRVLARPEGYTERQANWVSAQASQLRLRSTPAAITSLSRGLSTGAGSSPVLRLQLGALAAPPTAVPAAAAATAATAAAFLALRNSVAMSEAMIKATRGASLSLATHATITTAAAPPAPSTALPVSTPAPEQPASNGSGSVPPMALDATHMDDDDMAAADILGSLAGSKPVAGPFKNSRRPARQRRRSAPTAATAVPEGPPLAPVAAARPRSEEGAAVATFVATVAAKKAAGAAAVSAGLPAPAVSEVDSAQVAAALEGFSAQEGSLKRPKFSLFNASREITTMDEVARGNRRSLAQQRGPPLPPQPSVATMPSGLPSALPCSNASVLVAAPAPVAAAAPIAAAAAPIAAAAAPIAAAPPAAAAAPIAAAAAAAAAAAPPPPAAAAAVAAAAAAPADAGVTGLSRAAAAVAAAKAAADFLLGTVEESLTAIAAHRKLKAGANPPLSNALSFSAAVIAPLASVPNQQPEAPKLTNSTAAPIMGVVRHDKPVLAVAVATEEVAVSEALPRSTRRTSASRASALATAGKAAAETEGEGKAPRGRRRQRSVDADAARLADKLARQRVSTPQHRSLLARVRHQVARLKYEQHLLEVAGQDGQRAGQKRVALSAEVSRSIASCVRAKEQLQQCLRVCEEHEGVKALDPDHYDADDNMVDDKVFCGICRGKEVGQGNDIVLCDGPCSCAFHEKCVHIVSADIPPEDLWLCPACDCKEDIIEILNQALDTDYSLEDAWDKILATPPPSPTASAQPDKASRGIAADGAAGGGGVGSGEAGGPGSGGKTSGQGERLRPRRAATAGATATATATAAGVGVQPASGWLGEELPSDDEDDEDFDFKTHGTGAASGGAGDRDGDSFSSDSGSSSGSDSGDDDGSDDSQDHRDARSPSDADMRDVDGQAGMSADGNVGGAGGRGRKRKTSDLNHVGGDTVAVHPGAMSRAQAMALHTRSCNANGSGGHSPEDVVPDGVKRAHGPVDYKALALSLFGSGELRGEVVANGQESEEDADFKPSLARPRRGRAGQLPVLTRAAGIAKV